MKETSKAVKASRAKSGIKPTSIGLSDAEKKEIDEWAEELGVSRKDAILEAIRSARKQGKPTNAQLLAMLKDRLK